MSLPPSCLLEGGQETVAGAKVEVKNSTKAARQFCLSSLHRVSVWPVSSISAGYTNY
jgi:hypothetical protein